jgi:plasmid stability protein
VRRFIVQADDDLIRRVKKRAAQRGVSVAQIVRDALEAALGDGRQPAPSFIGKYSSGRTDDSIRASNDEYVAEPYASEP